MHKVFVYGTLKKGFYNNGAFPEGSKLIGNVVSLPAYTMITLGKFPGVVAEGQTVIKGELWEVSSMRYLDLLESNGDFYTRVKADFLDIEGEDVAAWIYLLPVGYIKEDNIIESGEWE